MRLVTYEYRGEIRTGALVDEHVVDLNRAYRAQVQATGDEAERRVADARLPVDMIALLQRGAAGMQAAGRAVEFARQRLAAGDESLAAAGLVCPAAEVKLQPPVLRPDKIVCLGLNYRGHAEETNWEPPPYPMLFHKTPNALNGQGGPIVIPRGCEQVDFEGELAVIIGRRAKYVTEAEALSYVAGYTVANDISERALQFRTRQFTTGKMIDTFCPLGPALVTRDEVADPQRLQITTRLNGEIMQQDSTALMIFSVPFIISYITSFATLEPGDVIMTGTPEGVGFARTPPRFLRPGDTLSVSIEGLGTLTSPVVADEA